MENDAHKEVVIFLFGAYTGSVNKISLNTVSLSIKENVIYIEMKGYLENKQVLIRLLKL